MLARTGVDVKGPCFVISGASLKAMPVASLTLASKAFWRTRSIARLACHSSMIGSSWRPSSISSASADVSVSATAGAANAGAVAMPWSLVFAGGQGRYHACPPKLRDLA
jgi:hypothetical protein